MPNSKTPHELEGVEHVVKIFMIADPVCASNNGALSGFQTACLSNAWPETANASIWCKQK